MKKVLLTGGTSGLGKDILGLLCKSENYVVHFTYVSSVKSKESFEAKFSNCCGYYCDFRSEKSVKDFLKEIKNESYDILINNAYTGDLLGKNFHKIDSQVFLTDFKQNILPIIQITQVVLVAMRKKKYGRIINVLSSAIRNPPLGSASYISVKAYLGMLSKSWAKEYAKFNISSNAILPSMMETKMLMNLDKRLVEQIKLNSPDNELLSTHETANVVIALIESTHKMTGQEILIDSSYHL